MFPVVLSHAVVHSFKFWYAEQLCEGMCSGKELYRLHTVFSAADRQQAFTVALDITERGYHVCITCTRSEYRVWVRLRRHAYAAEIHSLAA